MFILCLPTYSYSQNEDYLATHVKSKNVIQDSNGYIWFAGHNGLSRFDGNKTITFSSQNTQWNIPFTWIHNIRKDGDEFLISTESQQLWKFNPATAQSKKIALKIPASSVYNAIHYKNNYYFYSSKNIYKYSFNSKDTARLIKNIDITFLEKTNKHLYAAGKDGLYQLENGQFSLIMNKPITSLTPLENGIVFITNNEIIHIDDDMNKTKIDNTHQYIVSTKSNDNNILLLNKSGRVGKLSVTDLNEMEHHYQNLAPTMPKHIMQDASNTLWVITNKGIKKISPSFIKNYEKIYNVATNANEITLFDDKIVVGTYGDGIHSFNDLDPTLSLKINPNLTGSGKRTMDLLSIGNLLYIASFDGLWIYNSTKKTVEKANFSNNDKLLLKLTKHKHLLYIATNEDGFFLYDLNTKRIIDHVSIASGISSSEIIDIMTFDNKNIWLATPNGIDVYNLHTKKIKHIEIPGKSKVISFASANNKIYAATKGDGIFVLNFHGEILSQVGIGIDFSMISAINNEIWAPAQHGLFKINTKTDNIALVPNTEKYTFTDSPVQFNDNVYISHYGGMLEVPLKELENFDPVISISEINISGEAFLKHDHITVKSENDVISFQLASLDYRSGKSKSFQYKINEGGWFNVAGNQLTLTGLKSGQYNVSIKGTNSLGQWSKKQAYTEINVNYVWYATPQIKIIYFISFVLFILMVFWLLYLRSKSISNIHDLLAYELKTKGKSSFNVSRNLTLAKELLVNRTVPLSENSANQVITILQDSILELNSNDSSNEPNALFGKSLTVALPYFSNYVNNKYFVNLTVENDIQDINIAYELQSDIYKMIYESITSTIINGNGKNFQVSLQEFKQKIWLTISNNENSFTQYKNKINFDMSMYFIRQIVTKNNASINIFDKEALGSQIVISIPLMKLS